MSSRSACSTPHPSVGNISTASRPCSSITARRASRSLVLGPQRLDLHQRARVDALGDLAAEHQVEAAGHDDRVERRVRDEAEELAADEQERVLPCCTTCTPRSTELLVEVAGARVERLVVVVVGVDGPESDVHGLSVRRATRRDCAKYYNLSIGRPAAPEPWPLRRRRASCRRPRPHDRAKKPEQIADELRSLIVSGELAEGDSLGHEPDLVERFGVSRPSLREALRILEAEGLITVVRGVLGGVIVHEPNESMTARTAALVLQARNVTARRRPPGPQHDRAGRGAHPRGVGSAAASRSTSSRPLIEEQRAVARRSRGLRRGERPVPRASGRPGREPDVEHRRRDAQRDRGPGRHRGQPGAAAPQLARHPPAWHPLAGAAHRADRRSARASTPRRTGAPTWTPSARS